MKAKIQLFALLITLLSLACGLPVFLDETKPINTMEVVKRTPTLKITEPVATEPEPLPTETTAVLNNSPMGAAPVLGSNSKSEKNESPKYSIDVVYPVMEGDGSVVDPFNQEINAFINQTISTYKNEFNANESTDSEIGNYLDIHYETVLVSNNFVSIKFEVAFYSGGAHPNSYFKSYNYDLVQKRMLTLSDLFKPGVNYLDVISKYCKNELKNNLEDAFFEDGANPLEENYKSWNVQLDGLLISFDPYQVGPYAVGPQTVLIPESELADISAPDGRLNNQ